MFARRGRRGVIGIDTGELIAGHYRVLDRIGSGGMGVVWHARDERLQRAVAVKQLLLQPGLSAAETELARSRAMREARIAARLQHPNAIVVFDVAEHDGQPCLVLEYLPSRSLATVLAEQGPMHPAEAAAMGGQIASALAAAHAAGIVHRDVKPGNVLIGETGIAKITDFGVSRAVGDVTVTQTGIMAGTPAYLAPEVARGTEPGEASDVFSLGATLYAAVEGRTPFGDSDNPLALLHIVARGRVEPPVRSGPLTATLMDLLRSEPDERPDMRTAAERLTRIGRAGERATEPQRALRTAWPAPREQRPATMSMPIGGGTHGSGTHGSGSSGLGSHGPTRHAPVRQTPRPARMDHAAPPRQGPSVAGAPPRAAAPRTTGATGARNRPRPALLIAAISVVVALGVLITTIVVTGDDTQPTPPASQEQAQLPPATDTPVSESQAPPETDTPSDGGPIEYSPAGEVVIDYYNSIDSPDSAYALLTPSAQEQIGGRSGFDSYWETFGSVSARNANGVTPNDDGSVTVPVDVTYDGTTEKRMLRIVRLDGALLIDSDPR